MKQCTVQSATIIGARAVPVSVEVIVSTGMPGFAVVGMPDAAIQEARERVRAAIKSCGFRMPTEKVVVNLAPGSIKKTGSGFDLPIAAGILAATGQIPVSVLKDSLVIGELSLDGATKPVKGMLAYCMCASEEHRDIVLPAETMVPYRDERVHVRMVRTLEDFRTAHFTEPRALPQDAVAECNDYGDVGGHAMAKRALQIAATGNHGLLMMGPPGSGKTMLASRLPSILPPLDENQRLETARIHSIVGEDTSAILAGIRPFRAPHHSASLAGLTGGGNPVHPGELSLAHNGVLFLDEIAEFKPSVLQSIRKPIEDGEIAITRVDGNVILPARFMLVAASNPCPCGYCGDDKVACTCSPTQIHAYQNRIGGPLIDRIDMCIDVWRSDFDDVVQGDRSIDSACLRKGVMEGRAFAEKRRMRLPAGNERLQQSTKHLMDVCAMDDATKRFFKSMSEAYVLSGRGIMRTLGVARTIADIARSDRVEREHLSEALNMRVRSQAGRV